MVLVLLFGIPMQRYSIILIYQNKNQIIFAYLSIFIQNIGLPGFHAQFLIRKEKFFSFPRRKFCTAGAGEGIFKNVKKMEPVGACVIVLAKNLHLHFL